MQNTEKKNMLRFIYNHQTSSELNCFSALMSFLKYPACVSLTALEGDLAKMLEFISP